MARAVGIDLGTTNSVIAVYEAGEPSVIQNAEGGRTTPSFVAFTDTGERLVGQLARRQAILNPKGTIYSVKRFIGRKFEEVEEERWVRRDGLASDGRVAIISLTAAGRTAYAHFRAQFLAAMRADLEHVSDDRLHALSEATETLGALVDELQQRA